MMKDKIISMVEKHGICQVTGPVINKLFPFPDWFMNSTLILKGHRPEPTQDEQIEVFCNMNGLDFVRQSHGTVLFRKTQQEIERP